MKMELPTIMNNEEKKDEKVATLVDEKIEKK